MRRNRLFIGGLLAIAMLYVGSFVVTAAYAANPTTAGIAKVAKNAPVKAGFVGSSESKVYHKTTCMMVSKIKPENLVKFASKAEAEKAGYRPCAICCKPKP